MAVVPRISVVMPARNVADFIDEAIQSIVSQTLEDFEVVILDDASDDDTRARVDAWVHRDKRIRVFHAETRLGPVASSNFVVEKARGDLIVRMDADDVAHPDRLQVQFEALNAHPSAVLVGSLAYYIDSAGKRLRGPDTFRLLATAEIPFTHPSIMIRKAAFDRAGGYRIGTDYWEDTDLYARLSGQGAFLVSPLPLITVRFTDGSSRFATTAGQAEYSLRRQYDQAIERALAAGERPDRNVELRVLLHFARYRVWSGSRGRILVRALRLAKLAPSPFTMAALLFLAWAEASPKSLRFLLQQRARFRNMLARRSVRSDAIILWPSNSGEAATLGATPGPERASPAGHSHDLGPTDV